MLIQDLEIDAGRDTGTWRVGDNTYRFAGRFPPLRLLPGSGLLLLGPFKLHPFRGPLRVIPEFRLEVRRQLPERDRGNASPVENCDGGWCYSAPTNVLILNIVNCKV